MLSTITPRQWRLFGHDVLLISIMAVLAACGLIYEYLLSHYAGRILGIMETAIYTMIGIMIVSMGLGAFSAKLFKQPFTAFAWLEAIIALIGMSATLVIAAIIAGTHFIPEIISETFNLPPDTILNGERIENFKVISGYMPYFAGFLLGYFIGMEIPLIARVREQVYGKHLQNNAGTIYGADYIGAGVGAFIWVSIMLAMDITFAAALTAALNIFAGLVFLFRYWNYIRFNVLLFIIHLLLTGLLLLIAMFGTQWMDDFSNVLYKDHVIYRTNTPYQNITFTERRRSNNQPPIIDMYLNGRLQFSSSDETVYHSMLTYPVLSASARQENILIIGGGDGLALRDVLKWQPKQVTLIDLDADLVSLFSSRFAKKTDEETQALRATLMKLNRRAFEMTNVDVIFGDAFIEVEKLLDQSIKFDAIIVDLPDPSHPDLNKLYSDYFYARLKHLLSGDGAIAIQSTSPFHAKNAFLSVKKTLSEAGFHHVEQYRQNVPSFGEWGWTIAVTNGQSAYRRIMELPKLPVGDSYITLDLMKGAFAFPATFYNSYDSIKVNRLGSGVLYQYHTQAWQKEIGTFYDSQQNK